jgi:chromosome partitioning protein
MQEFVVNPAELFQRFSDEGERLLGRVRDRVTAPEHVKRLRTWGIQEAAALVGRTPQNLRQMEVPEGKIGQRLGEAPRDNRGHRYYTLERINGYRDLLGSRYHRPAGSRAVRCAVANFKGGAGKTTSCVHLAQKCALEGLATLVVDLDPQATLTLLFGLIPDLDVEREQTITDVLVSNPQMLQDVIRPTYFTGIDLIPANLSLQDAELSLANPRANEQDRLGLHAIQRLDEALKTVEHDYDVILFDCGPNLGILTLNAVHAATGMVVPMQPAMADFGSAVLFWQTMATLMESPRFGKALDFLKVLITRHTGSAEAKQTEAMVRLAFRDHVIESVMVQTVEIERAGNDFGTVYEIQQPRGSAEAYRRAFAALEAVNGELVETFKQAWQLQAAAVESKREVSHVG